MNDYDREIALIAVRNEQKTKEDEIIGVSRLIKVHGVNDAEFAVVVGAKLPDFILRQFAFRRPHSIPHFQI